MSRMVAHDFIDAARATSVTTGEFGPWTIRRVPISQEDEHWPSINAESLTSLHRITMATLHQPFGDVVMEDSAQELRKHLPIWMTARGDVLVTGLGLGCVLRGLLMKPDVRHVDVVEIDPTIMRVVGREFRGCTRVRLHLGDALRFRWRPRSRRWAFAWHDIWTEEGNGLPLHRMHMRLMLQYRHRVNRQGAWALPRSVKRFLPLVLG